jgi:hypothetical protein
MAGETPRVMEMTPARVPTRVLALDIRPRKAGFVVLEDNNLLDWGVRAYGKPLANLEVTVSQRIVSLLNLHSPIFVVIRKRKANLPAVAEALTAVTRIVRSEAKRRAIDFEIVSAGEVRRFFAEHGCHNKHEIAALLAKWFDELEWKLPPKRKPWQSEDHNMTIFDAAATATTFLWNESN